MPLERKEFLAGLGIPHFHRSVAGSAGQALAVRAEAHAPDSTRMPIESEEFLAGLGVPDLRCLAVGSSSQALAVRAERHAGDPASLGVVDGQELLAGLRVPHL